jgi:DNA-binding winged helix-turn-helix (wHTH) protein
MDTLPNFSFDGWTLRRSTGELHKGDLRIRLPIQSAWVLDELLSRPGDLVTRKTLIAAVWPRGVVEYDTALNTIVHRLRIALGDHADQPRYIETVPRRGYRFIGRIESAGAAPPAHAVRESQRMPPSRVAAAAAFVLLLATAGSVATRGRAPALGVADAVPSTAHDAREQVARARILLQRRGPGDVTRAANYFSAAATENPADANAWAGLASAHWLDVGEGRTPADVGLPRVIEAAERALRLDGRSAEAHMRLAAAYGRRGESTKADAHLRLARLHDPGHPLVLSAAIEDALAAGRLAQAIELQRRVVRAEPLAIAARQNLVALLNMAGHLDESAVENERIRELQPTAPGIEENKVEMLVLSGRFEEAVVLAQGLADETSRHFYVSVALHGLGRRAESDASLRRLMETAGDRDPVRVVEALAYNGERDEAISRLLASREACAKSWIQFSPYLRSLQGDPRWEAWVDS